ncbi:fasciclin domain-containing protein [Kaistia dalseonensis]|uniref:Surface protein with fasciclin (FAS1) repeats n=1 Tax=Kaistia dalseonensis TaxID=410840 RepID=A0ABU0HD31_9HYPH|nr:fasciclin domain-containing protein [Kaistia dalseonensis]MCX5497585.1 fasciclin domain-containing protein [Kaistia dalseonensis]MDQ0440225.1 putative surface protein with fasciclin (FAS1) repeats [Kaistia dalseonensis]
MSRFSTAIRAAAIAAIALSGTVAVSAPAYAKTVMVGGAPMSPTKNIVQNAANSKDHTTLVAAVKAAGLVDTLSGPGPFTVFAPTNEAFAKLPAGTVETLVMPANKAKLTSILTYHVIPGRISAADIMAAAKKMNGVVEYKTVEGESLKFQVMGKKIWIIDSKGDKARVTIPNVYQSNGVIHVIDTVLLPG